jgi:hypothetical protein
VKSFFDELEHILGLAIVDTVYGLFSKASSELKIGVHQEGRENQKGWLAVEN